MEEMNKYKISYMDGETKCEKVFMAQSEKEATDKFLEENPKALILYVSEVLEEKNEEDITNKKEKPVKKKDREPDDDVIIGGNLKEERRALEKEKRKALEALEVDKRKREPKKRNIENICATSLWLKIFLCVVGMALLLYPLIGLNKVLDSSVYDLFKMDVKLATIIYAAFAYGLIIGHIVQIGSLVWAYVIGYKRRSAMRIIVDRVIQIIMSFIILTIIIGAYTNIAYSEETMLLTEYYGFKYYIVSLMIFLIIPFTIKLEIKKD